jgi:hypothetical protein
VRKSAAPAVPIEEDDEEEEDIPMPASSLARRARPSTNRKPTQRSLADVREEDEEEDEVQVGRRSADVRNARPSTLPASVASRARPSNAPGTPEPASARRSLGRADQSLSSVGRRGGGADEEEEDDDLDGADGLGSVRMSFAEMSEGEDDPLGAGQDVFPEDLVDDYPDELRERTPGREASQRPSAKAKGKHRAYEPSPEPEPEPEVPMDEDLPPSDAPEPSPEPEEAHKFEVEQAPFVPQDDFEDLPEPEPEELEENQMDVDEPPPPEDDEEEAEAPPQSPKKVGPPKKGKKGKRRAEEEGADENRGSVAPKAKKNRIAGKTKKSELPRRLLSEGVLF